jgi:hypothetical protein
MNRREFFTSAAAGGVAALTTTSATAAQSPDDDRAYWVSALRRLADPILTNLANGTLKARMPVEQAAGGTRQTVTHLEAVGRLVAGIAPWLELPADDTPEGRLRAEYAALTRRALARAVDPTSPDFLNFTRSSQPLVDAAFLAEGVLRAPRALREALDPATTRQLIAALESTRVITPGFNNWLLFSATVEAGLKRLGAPYDRVRVDYALRQHDQWYKGDGTYGDGPAFHFDYYNSYVIHPMMLDVLDAVRDDYAAWKTLAPRAEERARRYAAIQERLIAADGSFPAVGRSIAYRAGAFHLLARSALHRTLPDDVSPAQVRGALTALQRRTLEAPGTFDAAGWLRIGLAGHQPGVGEAYISTGSLYLCATALLPLGLAPGDPFWSAPAQPWTAVKAWSGQPFPIDHALAN